MGLKREEQEILPFKRFAIARKVIWIVFFVGLLVDIIGVLVFAGWAIWKLLF